MNGRSTSRQRQAKAPFLYGGRLLEERQRLGLNQDRMAGLGRVAKRTYCNYESGLREPGAVFLEAIATAGADVLYVLTGVRDVAEPHRGESGHRARSKV